MGAFVSMNYCLSNYYLYRYILSLSALGHESPTFLALLGCPSGCVHFSSPDFQEPSLDLSRLFHLACDRATRACHGPAVPGGGVDGATSPPSPHVTPPPPVPSSPRCRSHTTDLSVGLRNGRRAVTSRAVFCRQQYVSVGDRCRCGIRSDLVLGYG